MIDESTNVTPDDARKLINACFADIRREVDLGDSFVPVTAFPELEVQEQMLLAEDEITRLTLENECNAYSRGTVKAAEAALASRGVDLECVSPESRLRLLGGFSRVLIERQRLNMARLLDPLADYQPADPLFMGVASVSPAAAPQGEAVGLSVQQAIDEYLSAKKATWRAKTHAARMVHLGYLSDFLGPDRRLSEIGATDVRGFRNALTMLRANHGRRKHLTFQERLTENGDARIKNKTAALIFEPVKAFLRWANKDEGLIDFNPAADVRWQSTAGPKGSRTRRPFSEAEIRKLFGSPLFTGCRSKDRRYQPGEMIIRDAKFWVPIIGYYTGMRLGEIIQLHVADVILNVQVQHFDLNEKSGPGDPKHIKTAAGIRKVPLHPDLIALGIADFVAERRKWNRPCKRLFSEIRLGSDGQASTEFSKLFARMMDRAGLTDPALTFHSFRHGAEDAFRNANLQQYTIDSIMGHSDGRVSSAYGEGPSLELKRDAVNAMKLPISLPGLLQSNGAS